MNKIDFLQAQAKMSALLSDVAKDLCSYLGNLLPSITGDWWKRCVVACLTPEQIRRVEKYGTNSLSSLDLAALLRVLDQNWYQISTNENLPKESRHFLKEMQTIRNRWAHAIPEGFSVDDLYRDFDTVQRFSAIIGATEDFLQTVKDLKRSLVSNEGPNSPAPESIDIQTRQDNSPESQEIKPGKMVCLISKPGTHGAVVEVVLSSPENRYKVFIEGKIQEYYASQIQVVQRHEEETIVLSADHFHAYLTALQIRYPGLSTLYSLNAARIDFVPYQFRPVLKFIRSDRPRLLIADSVGVGKTIEAGLILRELQARRDVKSILIICPRPLVTERKWLTEMKRFEERFTHLDGPTLRYCINEMDLEGTWPEQHQKAIVPYSLFDETLLHGSDKSGNRKSRRGLLDLDPPPRFDLVIVDEAHHIRNTETYSHQAVRFFCDNAEAVLFLTATPIQLGNRDLFVLLNTLRPDLIIDEESFKHMAEPNSFINQAVSAMRSQQSEWTTNCADLLEQAASTSWGQAILRHNPEFTRIQVRLSQGSVPLEERVEMITDMENLHTFSGIINRTRRRDIGDFTVRKPETIKVDFTSPQRELHDELLDVQAEIFASVRGDINVKFMMSTIRRQAASCLYGLVPFLDEILNRHLDEILWDEADDSMPVPGSDVVSSIEGRVRVVLEKARDLDTHDPKLEALRNVIRQKQVLPNNRIIIFSSFRHTLRYLEEHLRDDGLRIGMVHGGTSDEERISLRSRFEFPREDSSAIDIMLFSEIGCEGLDYQFCDCIVNYDLPWNPMRIEQRIGRIDRKGQQSEAVAIVNLITPGTVDADIYERCLLRIGIFNNALGGSEEILGEISNEIRSIAENFSLTEEDRQEKLQQLADNKIRLLQEQEELEQRQLELFGIRFPEEQFKKEIAEASSYWLSPASLHRLILLYCQLIDGKDQESILGEKALKTLRLSQEARSKLLQDFHKLPRQNAPLYREWENWLKGVDPHLPITFESECAVLYPKAVFLMPVHPLVRQAAMAFEAEGKIVTSLMVRSNSVPHGKYEFAIYQWQFHGIKENQLLQPIAKSEVVSRHLPALLETAEAIEAGGVGPGMANAWEYLEEKHYELWSQARSNHRQRTLEIAAFRKESLAASHRARMLLLEEQLQRSDDDKIRRMRQSQIATAGADYARHLQELDIAVERADVTAALVVRGVLLVLRDR